MSKIGVTLLKLRPELCRYRKEVRVTGLEGMSREELENKLSELSQKIDGYNAKTIEAKPEHVEEIENS